MSRHPAAAEASTASIPKELWYPTPVHTNAMPAARPQLSRQTRLMPLVALVGSYTSARASTAHIDAATSALLLLTSAALNAFGVGVARHGVATVRHHRPGRPTVSGGAVAAGAHLIAVAAVLVGLTAAAAAVTLAGLLRSRL